MLDENRRAMCESGMVSLAEALALSEEDRTQRDEETCDECFPMNNLDKVQFEKDGSKVFETVWAAAVFTVLQECSANSQVLMIGKTITAKKKAWAEKYILKIFDLVRGKRQHCFPPGLL